MKSLIAEDIDEESIIMIEFENGENQPFWVAKKSVGGLTGANTLLGHQIRSIAITPSLYNLEKPTNWERFYIGSKNKPGGHKGVLKYRKLDKKELLVCQGILIEAASESISEASELSKILKEKAESLTAS